VEDLIYSSTIAVYSLGKIREGGEVLMLSWSILFLVVAIVAGVLGFSGIAGAAAGIAKVLFFVFLVVFIISLIMGRRPTV
jgi:uncharacterized membrane protein YtjA (UPF0391 family)